MLRDYPTENINVVTTTARDIYEQWTYSNCNAAIWLGKPVTMQLISQGRRLGLLVRTAPPFAIPLCCRRRLTKGIYVSFLRRVRIEVSTWIRCWSYIDTASIDGWSEKVTAVERGYGTIEWHCKDNVLFDIGVVVRLFPVARWLIQTTGYLNLSLISPEWDLYSIKSKNEKDNCAVNSPEIVPPMQLFTALQSMMRAVHRSSSDVTFLLQRRLSLIG